MGRARVQFGPPGTKPVAEAEQVLIGASNQKAKNPRAKKEPKKEKVKIDPAYVLAARELRDRYLEMLNSGQIPLPTTRAKYAIERASPIADCQLPIEKRSNRQLEMGNGQSLLDAA